MHINKQERRNRKRNIKKKAFIASLNRGIQLSRHLSPHWVGGTTHKGQKYAHPYIRTSFTLLRGETKDKGCESKCVWFRFGCVRSGVMGCFRLSPLLPWGSKQLSWRQGPQGDQGVRGQCFWQRMKQDSANGGKGPVHKFLPTGRLTNNEKTTDRQFQRQIFSKLYKTHFLRSNRSSHKNKCNSNPTFSLCGHRLPFKSKNRNAKETKSPPRRYALSLNSLWRIKWNERNLQNLFSSIFMLLMFRLSFALITFAYCTVRWTYY